MKKDIFIDTNIAKNFTNPMDREYLKLILWLQKYDPKTKDTCAHLAVSKKLLVEYYASAQGAKSSTCMPVIIDQLTREDRLVRLSSQEIKEFQRTHFTPKVEKTLKCNAKDRDHIPVVLLSHRKYVLSIDDNFLNDLVNFPKHKVTAAKRPENIPYAK